MKDLNIEQLQQLKNIVVYDIKNCARIPGVRKEYRENNILILNAILMEIEKR